MLTQIILAVDDVGKFLEYIPKEAGHTGDGKKHLAISVLIYNNKGQVLLQKRKHKVFNNIWDITGATHPLHKVDGSDETFEQATRRCLETEWGIREIGEIKKIGEFNYFAKAGPYCENEHCAMMVGEYNGSISLNPSVGYEYKWMYKNEFINDVEKNPENYTPWANEGARILKRVNFFERR